MKPAPTPFFAELQSSILATIKRLKRGGTVAMSLANLRQVTPTPRATEGAPCGGNLYWQYCNLFQDAVNSLPAARKFLLP